MNSLEAAIASARQHLQIAALPVGPGLDEEDEFRRRRVGAGSAPERGRRRTGSVGLGGRLIAFRPLLVRPAAKAKPGSGLAAKARLASGAQPAVVKVASFAGGPARVKSLLDYLSRQGELSVEDETGTEIHGREQVLDFSRRWGDRFDGRAESRDVVFVRMRIPGAALSSADERVGGVAGDRPFAYHAGQEAGELRIDLVVGVRSPADGSRLPLRGRAFADHIERGAGKGTRAELAGWGHAEAGAVRLLQKLTAGAEGRRIVESAGRPLTDDANVREVATDWAGTMRPRSPRDTMHLVVSARAGTDREAFKDSVRDYLAAAFPGHRYAFALHQDRPHLHAHAVITMRAADGSRLHPNITDFHAWRGMFAEAAREHGLAFTATRRHDRAAAPAYKLKHVRAVERGDALERTRRRVALKKADAVVAPRTDQGRAAASAAAQEWRQVAGEPQESETQIASRMLERVYWGKALGGDAADQVLKQMAAGLVSEVAMARMTEAEARRGLDAIRETAAGVSSRFLDQTARQEFDRAAGDLVRLVEDRISVKLRADVPDARPAASGTAAGGGGSAPARGEGGPSARQELDDRSSGSGREIDETGRASDRGQARGAAERISEVGQASGQGGQQPAAKAAVPASSPDASEEKLRERIERERAQGRDVER